MQQGELEKWLATLRAKPRDDRSGLRAVLEKLGIDYPEDQLRMLRKSIPPEGEYDWRESPTGIWIYRNRDLHDLLGRVKGKLPKRREP
jgi:hypothetical protein